MQKQFADILKDKLDAESFAKLDALGNDKLNAFVADAVVLCQPDSVKVCSDDAEDVAYIRQRAVETGEEHALATEGHTYHFDGYTHEGRHDQGRDKEVTKYLVPKDMSLDKTLNQTERLAGLEEVRGFIAGSMRGKQMYVRFLSLGPTNSAFGIPCAQVTDSAYVAHSEDLLYRAGYEEFRRIGNTSNFFRFMHSAGRLENHVSADYEKRRIYIDIADEVVYSVNTQYAGNTVGLKKLALRLAIRKADREGWLAEHMFLLGVHGPKGRVTYFSGAYPSACGKTSTAMLPGESIVGDDLAYLRAVKGVARAVNVESGIFGIIEDVNAKDDPVIYKVITTPGEVIFSNILVKDGKPHWMGMGQALPAEGLNYSGQWQVGKLDSNGKKINPSHKNARYTVRLTTLANLDPNWNNPEGVQVGGIIYGGRDSDTWVPVQQSFEWAHGIIVMGASLESETTAATLGAQGVRTFNLMSNLDFLAIPLGKYIQNNLDFAKGLKKLPLIFGTNYFLKAADGSYLNGKLDKGIWVRWMELRVHGECDAIPSPTGLLPKHEDLVPLFREKLNKDYTQAEYVQQFTIRVPENLAKVDRIEKIYCGIQGIPQIVFDQLDAQRKRLRDLQAAKGDYVSPLDL
jgi:phosphoenolpyruvate carboxykinase (GTP)